MGDRGPSGAQGQVQGQPGADVEEPQREADGDGLERARVRGTMGQQDRRPEAAAGNYIFSVGRCLLSSGPRGWQPHGPGWYARVPPKPEPR